jgi:5-methylcytosine-specific restriction endonuclease McrA
VAALVTIKRYPPKSQRPGRTGTYSRHAKKIRDAARADPAAICWLCQKPFSPDDPPVADHRIPRALGGSDDITNLVAAHRSCNGRRGQLLSEPFIAYAGVFKLKIFPRPPR